MIAVAVAAGCGGDGGTSKEEYQQVVGDTNEKLQAALDKVSTTGEELETIGEAADTVDAARRIVNGEAERLGALAPPEDVEEAHADLVDALEELENDLEDLSREIEQAELEEVNPPQGQSPKLEQLAQRMRDLDFKAIEQVRDALRAIEQQGYDVGAAR